MSLKQRIRAGEAIARARELVVSPEEWRAWLASLGLNWRAAHALCVFREQDRWQPANPEHLARTATR